MTAATLGRGGGLGELAPGLASRRLSRWALVGLLVGVVALALLLFWLTPLQGRADFGVFVVLVYLAAQTVLSGIVEGRRRAVDRLVLGGVVAAFLVALAPLVSLVAYTIDKGTKRFDGTFFTHSMNNIAESDVGGGAYHAIIGTLEQVGIATVIAVPFGVLVAIYLTEYSRGWFGRMISFLVDVMSGIPSIVAGLFILSLWILTLNRGYSGFAGSLALVVLMLPLVVRSSEEMLKLVPTALREGGNALGMNRITVTLRIVLPTALPGIVTGIMLAIARVAGETAPVLLTVFGTQRINTNPFTGPQESLPLFIFNEAGNPDQTAIDRAWTGALTLIIIVLVLNLLARLIVRFVGRNRA